MLELAKCQFGLISKLGRSVGVGGGGGGGGEWDRVKFLLKKKFD